MLWPTTLIVSAIVSFLAHDWGERFFTRKRRKKVRFLVRGYQIHHSFFGVLAILAAFVVTSSITTAVLFGYGIGNIWQHKRTHNNAKEKGLVFITKAHKHKFL